MGKLRYSDEQESVDANPVIAVLCSDLHLSHRPPLFRSPEPDWYVAMGRQLDELAEVAKGLPIVCAGDLFDKWNPPPELINFAIARLPRVYAVPGQHDLPNHSYRDIKRSAYWTLAAAGNVVDLKPGEPVEVNDGPTPIRLHGFPWGAEPEPLRDPCPIALDVAVIHRYVWRSGCGYDGAPAEARLGRFRKALRGFDLAVVGDNHVPFDFPANGDGKPAVFNCGGFFRRKSDEAIHLPSVGLLRADGFVDRQCLDVSADRVLDQSELGRTLAGIGVETFVEELQSLASSAVDYAEVVRRLMEREKVSPEVKGLLSRILEEARG